MHFNLVIIIYEKDIMIIMYTVYIKAKVKRQQIFLWHIFFTYTHIVYYTYKN